MLCTYHHPSTQSQILYQLHTVRRRGSRPDPCASSWPLRPTPVRLGALSLRKSYSLLQSWREKMIGDAVHFFSSIESSKLNKRRWERFVWRYLNKTDSSTSTRHWRARRCASENIPGCILTVDGLTAEQVRVDYTWFGISGYLNILTADLASLPVARPIPPC